MSPERPSNPAGRSGAPQDTKSVLYEAAVEAVHDRTAQAKKKPVGRKARSSHQGLRIAVLLLLALTGAALLVLRPSWLVGPETLPAESPAIAAASLRVALVRERDMVFRYRRRTGSLPITLGAAGISTPNLDYDHEGVAFSLSGRAGDSLITIRSADSVTAFLGDSFSRLRHRNSP